MIASEQRETLVLMQFPGCFQGFIVDALVLVFSGRSATLRGGLRRKERFFGGIITADLKVCSTPFRSVDLEFRAAFLADFS
jgi:hypothetical protein